MYSKTIISTFELISCFKITKTLLHNIVVHLINFSKEMHHAFINIMFKGLALLKSVISNDLK